MAAKRLAARLPSLLPSSAPFSPVASGSKTASSARSTSRRAFSSTAPVLARKDVPPPTTKPKARAAAADDPELVLGELAPNRLRDHYQHALADDLLYLNYSHRLAIDPDLPQANLSWLEKDPSSSFAANRPHPRAPGARAAYVPVRHAVNELNVPRLEAVVVSTFVKDAIARKSALLPAIHALRTVTGQVKQGGNDRSKAGVEIIKGKKGAATWHLRSGMPVGAKVTLKGHDMYRFIESLTEFVFPRIRDWPGVPLQPAGTKPDPTSGDETAGVVSFGFETAVLPLFPQVEAALGVYPKLPGFNINFITNQRGVGAKWRARMLLSGFRFPYFTPDKPRQSKSRYNAKGGKKRR